MKLNERNLTRLPTAVIPPFGLRMQQELKSELERFAAQAGRSLNAEIVHRLQNSLSLQIVGLSDEAKGAVAQMCDSQGMAYSDAASSLILAGASKTSTIVILRVGAGATVQEYRQAFDAAGELTPDSLVHIEAGESEASRNPSPADCANVGAYIEIYNGNGVIEIRRG